MKNNNTYDSDTYYEEIEINSSDYNFQTYVAEKGSQNTPLISSSSESDENENVYCPTISAENVQRVKKSLFQTKQEINIPTDTMNGIYSIPDTHGIENINTEPFEESEGIHCNSKKNVKNIPKMKVSKNGPKNNNKKTNTIKKKSDIFPPNFQLITKKANTAPVKKPTRSEKISKNNAEQFLQKISAKRAMSSPTEKSKQPVRLKNGISPSNQLTTARQISQSKDASFPGLIPKTAANYQPSQVSPSSQLVSNSSTRPVPRIPHSTSPRTGYDNGDCSVPKPHPPISSNHVRAITSTEECGRVANFSPGLSPLTNNENRVSKNDHKIKKLANSRIKSKVFLSNSRSIENKENTAVIPLFTRFDEVNSCLAPTKTMDTTDIADIPKRKVPKNDGEKFLHEIAAKRAKSSLTEKSKQSVRLKNGISPSYQLTTARQISQSKDTSSPALIPKTAANYQPSEVLLSSQLVSTTSTRPVPRMPHSTSPRTGYDNGDCSISKLNPPTSSDHVRATTSTRESWRVANFSPELSPLTNHENGGVSQSHELTSAHQTSQADHTSYPGFIPETTSNHHNSQILPLSQLVSTTSPHSVPRMPHSLSLQSPGTGYENAVFSEPSNHNPILFQRILEYLIEVKKYQRDMMEDMKAIKNQLSKLSSSHDSLNIADFYSNSEEDLKNVERRLVEQKTLKKSLGAEILKNYVGGTLSSSVRRIFDALFDDKLLQLYSLKGNKGKKKFNRLQIFAVIKSSLIMKNFPIDEIGTTISKDLANSKTRMKRRAELSGRENHQDDHDESLFDESNV